MESISPQLLLNIDNPTIPSGQTIVNSNLISFTPLITPSAEIPLEVNSRTSSRLREKEATGGKRKGYDYY